MTKKCSLRISRRSLALLFSLYFTVAQPRLCFVNWHVATAESFKVKSAHLLFLNTEKSRDGERKMYKKQIFTDNTNQIILALAKA